MKKYFLLLLILLLTTGCRAEYNLVYENNELSESLDILSSKDTVYDNEKFSNLVDDAYRNSNYLVDYNLQPGDIPEEDWDLYADVYNKKIINNDLYGLNLSYKYTDNSYYTRSSIANSLFEKVVINDYNLKAYNIKNVFDYNHLDEIVVIFRTDKYVKSSNSDEIKDGVYYWFINRNNYSDKNIDIKFDVEKNENEGIINDGYLTKNSIKFLFLILLLLVLISIYIIYKKIKNSNK